MKRLFSLIILFVIVVVSLHAQIKLDYNISYASYKMSDMKDLMQTIKHSEQLNMLGMEVVESFPSYIAHSVNIGYRLNNHEFGVKSSFYTTGGKISVGDYSGAINVTLTTNGFREGIYYRNYFYTYSSVNSDNTSTDKFSLWGEVSPAVIISNLKLKTEVSDIEISRVVENDAYSKLAYGLLFQLGGKYYLTKNLSVDLLAGYEASFGGNFDDLINSPRIDWSGFRLSGGIGVSF